MVGKYCIQMIEKNVICVRHKFNEKKYFTKIKILVRKKSCDFRLISLLNFAYWSIFQTKVLRVEHCCVFLNKNVGSKLNLPIMFVRMTWNVFFNAVPDPMFLFYFESEISHFGRVVYQTYIRKITWSLSWLRIKVIANDLSDVISCQLGISADGTTIHSCLKS